MANNVMITNAPEETEDDLRKQEEAKQQAKKEVKPPAIEIIDHPSFEEESCLKSKIMNTIELSDKIGDIMGSVFHDYIGCKIFVNNGSDPRLMNPFTPVGTLYVSLYFKDMGKADEGGPIKALYNIHSEPKGDDMLSRYNRLAGGRHTDLFKFKDLTFQLLQEFALPGINLKYCDFESKINMTPGYQTNKEEVVRVIPYLDLRLLVTLIYGKKIDGRDMEYMVTLQNYVNGFPEESVIEIKQIDRDVIYSLARSLNLNGPTGRTDFHPYYRH